MSSIATNLNALRAHGPCAPGWTKHLKATGKTQPDDEVLTYADIVRLNGFDDALWSCRAAPEYEAVWRSYSSWCAAEASVSAKSDQAKKFAALAVRASRAEEWSAAIRDTPPLAIKSIAWEAFDRGEDFTAAETVATEKFVAEFLCRVNGVTGEKP